MDPRDDENAFPHGEPDGAEPLIRELRLEMVRLQAQIDQLDASSRERTAEIADVRARLTELERRLGAIRSRYLRDVKMWVLVAGLYGVAAGIGMTYLFRW